jgi:hypothetical protein
MNAISYDALHVCECVCLCVMFPGRILQIDRTLYVYSLMVNCFTIFSIHVYSVRGGCMFCVTIHPQYIEPYG